MKNILTFFTGILITLFGGMTSGLLVTKNTLSWYRKLNKPFFTPPNALFGPVWTVLYITLGIVLVLLWKQKEEQPYIFWLFVIHLLLNFSWTPFFFGLHQISSALVIIFTLLLTLTILLTLMTKNGQIQIALLLLPYFLWLSYATLLNTQLWILNP